MWIFIITVVLFITLLIWRSHQHRKNEYHRHNSERAVEKQTPVQQVRTYTITPPKVKSPAPPLRKRPSNSKPNSIERSGERKSTSSAKKSISTSKKKRNTRKPKPTKKRIVKRKNLTAKQIGNMGERMTYDALREQTVFPGAIVIGNPDDENLVFHFKSGNGTFQVDHIMLTPRGILVVETKYHGGRVYGSYGMASWQQYTWSGEKRTFQNPILQNDGHIRNLAELLELSPKKFVGVVVFSNKSVNIDKVVNDAQCGKVVIKLSGLAKFLRGMKSRGSHLSEDELKTIKRKIDKLVDRSRGASARHVKYVRSLHVNDW